MAGVDEASVKILDIYNDEDISIEDRISYFFKDYPVIDQDKITTVLQILLQSVNK